MNFELKNVVSVGDVISKDAGNSIQGLSITAGVVGCPYNMVETQLVPYEFANTLSVQEAKDGVQTFAENWVATNYPAI
jgi:hypothetical protein